MENRPREPRDPARRPQRRVPPPGPSAPGTPPGGWPADRRGTPDRSQPEQNPGYSPPQRRPRPAVPPSSSQPLPHSGQRPAYPERPGQRRGDALPRPLKHSPRDGERRPPPANSAAVSTVPTRPAKPAHGDGGNRVPPSPTVRPSAPEQAPPPPRRVTHKAPRRRERPALRTLKTMAAVLSVLVFGATAYAWTTFGDFFEGFTTADVLSAGAGGEKPADGAVDILLVGMDSRTDAQGNPLPKDTLRYLRAGVADGELNTDTLILLHIPNDGGQAVAHSIPRDSYVDIPGGYGQHKINSAYQRAKSDALKKLQHEGIEDKRELEVKSNQEGAKELVQTVQQLTGSTIDHYASVNLLGFYEITKAIGGVDVCLNDAVDEPLSGAEFKKGKQTIQGRQALAFVRQRHDLPRGDLDRIARQQAFLAGIANKVLSAGTLTDQDKLDALLSAVRKSVVLDQQWDIAGFATQMQGLTGGKIKFQTIPVGNLALPTPEDGVAVEVDPDEVQQAIRGSDDSGDKQQAQGQSEEQKQANSQITVGVRNASLVEDLASTVLDKLTAMGFQPGQTGNTEQLSETVIRYPAGERDNGQKVADVLRSPAILEEDETVPSGSIRVLLGGDYHGVGSESTSSGTEGQQASATSETPKPPQKPITADGVTCVN